VLNEIYDVNDSNNTKIFNPTILRIINKRKASNYHIEFGDDLNQFNKTLKNVFLVFGCVFVVTGSLVGVIIISEYSFIALNKPVLGLKLNKF
jgi:hypothetical protein